MLSRLSALILRLWGWKITGHYPHELKKVIVAVAPHTSSWDFPLGVLVNSAGRCHANYMGKHTLFKPPFGFFFRWLGGIPVDRTQNHNLVAATVEAFKTNDRIHLVIAPEGTRKKVEKLKTGFYHIARLAQVPICLCTFDWEAKKVVFDPVLFHTTGNEEADLAYIWNYFKGIKGAKPEWGIISEE
jgi:1-acyl-sn-glycerol-3-phosphate acyltransferase